MFFYMLLCLFAFSAASEISCNGGHCYCQIGKLVQTKSATYNGCGPEENHITVPLDWGFERVCNNHDICYGTCGKYRQLCDNDFGDGLVIKCIDNVGPGSARDYCMLTANMMYDAVKHYGNTFFEQAQKEDCKC